MSSSFESDLQKALASDEPQAKRKRAKAVNGADSSASGKKQPKKKSSTKGGKTDNAKTQPQKKGGKKGGSAKKDDKRKFDLKETIAKVTDFAKTHTGIAIGATAAVALMLGLMFGCSAGGGSQTETQTQVQTTSSTTPAYDQMESMREATITSLQSQLAAAASSTQLTSDVQAKLSALNSSMTALSASVQPVIEAYVSSGVSGDNVQKYLTDPSSLDQTTSEAVKAFLVGLDSELADTTSDGGTSAKFGGASVSADGNTRKVVSSPTLSLVSIGSGNETSGYTSTVYVALAPTSDADGNIKDAVFIVGVDSSNAVTALYYAGLLDSTGSVDLPSYIVQAQGN